MIYGYITFACVCFVYGQTVQLFLGNPSQSYGTSPAMWVTCYLTQVNAPRFNPSQTSWYLIYLPRRDGRLSFLILCACSVCSFAVAAFAVVVDDAVDIAGQLQEEASRRWLQQQRRL